MVNNDRGQLILVGALLVAATILGSITLLNSIHESPEIKTEQDTQSLDETEQKATEIRDDLERLFLHNVSVSEWNEPLPYTNNSFDGTVEEYTNQSLNLSTTNTTGIVAVEYLGGGEGTVFRQNQTDSGDYEALPGTSSGTPVMESAQTIPQLSVFVNQTAGSPSGPLRIRLSSSGAVELQIYNDRIDRLPVGGPPAVTVCDRDGRNDEVRINIVKGTGEIQTGDDYCGDIRFGDVLIPPYTVSFNNGNTANGTATVTGTAPTPSFSPTFPNSYQNYIETDSTGDPIVVNPKFDVEYRTPNVFYETTYALYNSTGR